MTQNWAIRLKAAMALSGGAEAAWMLLHDGRGAGQSKKAERAAMSSIMAASALAKSGEAKCGSLTACAAWELAERMARKNEWLEAAVFASAGRKSLMEQGEI